VRHTRARGSAVKILTRARERSGRGRGRYRFSAAPGASEARGPSGGCTERTSSRGGIERRNSSHHGGQKIRIRLKAYDHEVVDSSARKIVETVTRTGRRLLAGATATEINRFCVIRSPHKYKDSREHFEMRTHKRLIDIIDPTPKNG